MEEMNWVGRPDPEDTYSFREEGLEPISSNFQEEDLEPTSSSFQEEELEPTSSNYFEDDILSENDDDIDVDASHILSEDVSSDNDSRVDVWSVDDEEKVDKQNFDSDSEQSERDSLGRSIDPSAHEPSRYDDRYRIKPDPYDEDDRPNEHSIDSRSWGDNDNDIENPSISYRTFGFENENSSEFSSKSSDREVSRGTDSRSESRGSSGIEVEEIVEFDSVSKKDGELNRDGFEDEPKEESEATVQTSRERRIITCLSVGVCCLVILLIIAIAVGIGVGVSRNKKPTPTPTFPPTIAPSLQETTLGPVTKPSPSPTIIPETKRPTNLPTGNPVGEPNTPGGEPNTPVEEPNTPVEEPNTPVEEPGTPSTSSPASEPTFSPVSAPPEVPETIAPSTNLPSRPSNGVPPEPSDASTPSTASPSTPSASLPTPQNSDLLELLISNSLDGGKAVLENGTPQNEAYKWLSRNAFLSIYSNEQILTRYALATFFYATNGPNTWDAFVRDDGWLTDAPECEWGSTANNQCTKGVYTSLTLDFIGVSGTIPQELGLLTGLERFSVRSSSEASAMISGSLPDVFGSFSNMQTIRLNDNNLTGLIPISFGSMKNCLVLILSGNSLIGKIPAGLANIRGRTLNLSNNQLSGPIPSELFNLAELKILNLEDNNLSGTIPSEIGLATSITNINFSNNQLGGFIPSEIGNLVEIRSAINLSSNQLGGKIPSEIGRLGKMRNFEVQNNLLAGSIPAQLSGMKNIELFRIDNNAGIVGSMPEAVCESFGTTAIIYSDCGLESFQCDCCTYCCDGGGCECNVADADVCGEDFTGARVPFM